MVLFYLFCTLSHFHLSKLGSIGVFSLAAALFFGVVAFTFREVDLSHLFSSTSSGQIFLLLGLGLLFHISFGVIMWVGFWLHYQLKIDKSEILTLPLMMHLFLYLMPIKGGMLFQVFYSKHKYNLDLSKGFSLGLMVFLNSIVLTVIVGLALAYLIPVESFELRLTIILMGIALFGLWATLLVLPSKPRDGDGALNKIINFFINVQVQLADQLRNTKLFFGLLISTSVSVTIQAIWFWKTAEILGIESEFPAVFLVVLVLRVVLLIRLLPGNLGIQEVMIGVVFSAAGFQLEDGLLIGVITRLISVFWSATIGLPALYSNLKHFDSLSISGLINKVAKSNK